MESIKEEPKIDDENSENIDYFPQLNGNQTNALLPEEDNNNKNYKNID